MEKDLQHVRGLVDARRKRDAGFARRERCAVVVDEERIDERADAVAEQHQQCDATQERRTERLDRAGNDAAADHALIAIGLARNRMAPGPAEHPVDAGDAEQKQQAGYDEQPLHADDEDERFGQCRPRDRTERAADRDQRKQPTRLLAVENVRHQAPEQRDDQQVEHAAPDEEQRAKQGRVGTGLQ